MGQVRASGDALTKAMLDAEWRAVDDEKHEAETPIEAAARGYFEAERDRVVQRLRDRQMQRLDELITVDSIFDVQEAIERLLQAVSPAIRDAVEQGFLAGLERIEGDGVFDPESPAAKQIVQQVNSNLEEVPRTTRDKLNQTILKAYADGTPMDELVQQVQGLYDGTEDTEGFTEARSRLIAQTSGTAAFERGQLASWEDAGLQSKEWLTTRDGRQRDGHGEANGQRRNTDERFRVRPDASKAFDEMMHPGDPTASVHNVANCRCTMLPRRAPVDDTDTEA